MSCSCPAYLAHGDCVDADVLAALFDLQRRDVAFEVRGEPERGRAA